MTRIMTWTNIVEGELEVTDGMNNGTAALYHDNDAHGEDECIIRELSGTSILDAVLDGVTHCQGAYASGFAAELLQNATIDSVSDLMDVLEQANLTLFQSGQGSNLLTTVSVALKVEDELYVVNAGDSPMYLVRDDELLELAAIIDAGPLANLSNGALGLKEKFNYSSKSVSLRPHDRIILLTDGLSNNLFAEELGTIVRKGTSPRDAVSALEEIVAERRRLHKGRGDSYVTFKEDDQTAIIRFFD